MEPGKLIDSWLDFFSSHTIFAIAIIVALGILAYLKPKVMFKLVIVVLAIGAIVYVISFIVDLTSTGIDEKYKFISNPKITFVTPP